MMTNQYVTSFSILYLIYFSFNPLRIEKKNKLYLEVLYPYVTST
jgi:hypothetical protein